MEARRTFRGLGTTAALALALALALGGCALLSPSQHRANSVVEYLYAGRIGERVETKVPTLRLPLRVGIAFVPPAIGSDAEVISEAKRIELMRKIVPSFEALEFVDTIEIIPTPYLRPRGGFTNLDQLRTMFGIDVIALLSYDQVQFSSEGLASISYWTLFGAYVVRGELNDTHTMIDAAVYDIASRQLLFRAPGISQVKGQATPVGQKDRLRRDRETGFEQAAADLIPNLQEQVDVFSVDVKEKRKEAEIITTPGYTGAGSLGAPALLVAGMLGLGFARLRGLRATGS